MEFCVGAWRAFDDLMWRKVYAPVFRCGDVDGATACLARPSTIYLAQPVLHSQWTVKAELIHYVRRNGLHDGLALRCSGEDQE